MASILLGGNIMPTTKNDIERTVCVTMTIRIPPGSDGDLGTAATARLSQAADVADVSVQRLRGLEPRLSATVVTIEVAVRTSLDDGELGTALRGVPGVRTVEMR